MPCNEGCTACTTAAGVCQACKPGYYRSAATGDTNCLKCPVNCVACTSNTVCTTCAVGFTQPQSNAGANPQICTAPCNNCLACSAPALTAANSPGTCSSCKEGFYLKAPACEPCTGNCKACTGANQCTTCNDGSYKTTTAGVAPAPATDTCTICTPASNCKTCTSATPGVCTACPNGRFLFTDNTCMPCGADCTTCTSSTKCTVCNPGVYLKNDGSCGPCTDNSPVCKVCTSATVCTSCNTLPTSDGTTFPPSTLFLNGAGTTADPRICTGTCPVGFFD